MASKKILCLSRGVKQTKLIPVLATPKGSETVKTLSDTQRKKSTAASAFSIDATLATNEPDVARDQLDLSFQDAKTAFKSKTSWEVFRAWLVFQLCSSEWIVDNNKKLMNLGKNVLGKTLFGLVMKSTFYGQFVAGADRHEIKPVIERMRSFGVKSILDYSAEEDLSTEEAEKLEMKSCTPVEENETDETKDADSNDVLVKKYHAHEAFADRRRNVVGARTYFYMNEAQCERNLDTFLNCIDAVSGTTKSTGFAAIKVTALGRPQLLMQLSEVIARTRRYFREVTGMHQHGNIVKHHIQKDAFSHKLEEEVADPKMLQDPDVKDFLKQMTFDKKGLIHLFSWHGLIDANVLLSDLFRVPNLHTGQMEPIISSLTDEEEEMFANMMRRLRLIFQHAKDNNVRVMVDAEQAYFQPAISRITMEMMRKYNKEKAIVFNTYQCYLKEAYESVVLDLEQAFRQGFYFGAKLVRGAYMEQERARAMLLGYDDPINPTYEATTDMYHKTMTECMHRIVDLKNRGMDPQRIAIMAATHNEDTVRFCVQKMQELGIGPQDRVLCFGQLLGMCDQISFPLGQAGYSVYKYVPYGPVHEVLPYLSRRAYENKGFLKNVKKEKSLLAMELRRRLVRGQLFHRPKGEYPIL